MQTTAAADTLSVSQEKVEASLRVETSPEPAVLEVAVCLAAPLRGEEALGMDSKD